jgi:hypothetical protein
MTLEAKRRPRKGCLAASLAVAGVALVLAVVVAVVLVRWTGDAAGTGHLLLSVLKGEKPFEQAITEIIIKRMAEEANVPPAEVEKLNRELGGISGDLPELSEGEKHELAMLIRKAVADGRLEDEEITNIREYSRRSARDGDVKP